MDGQAPRCALLFALPVDREGFDSVVRGESLNDYRELLLRGEPPERVWEQRYARVAAAAQVLIDVARQAGARVTTRATLEDLAQASSVSDVVIVMGHWRGWVVTEADLHADAGPIVARLSQCGLEDVSSSKTPSRSQLARDLNEAIEAGRLLAIVGDALTGTAADQALNATVARDALDELLGDLIVPGNHVELYDGLHTPSSFEEALDAGFCGDLDLATCTSIALATLISIRRGTTVRLVHTLDLVDPLQCYVAIAETLRRLASEGGTYTSARLETERRLVEVRRQLRRETRSR